MGRDGGSSLPVSECLSDLPLLNSEPSAFVRKVWSYSTLVEVGATGILQARTRLNGWTQALHEPEIRQFAPTVCEIVIDTEATGFDPVGPLQRNEGARGISDGYLQSNLSRHGCGGVDLLAL
jgi:hypothetical protein